MKPKRIIPKISIDEFTKLIFTPTLFKTNTTKGTMAMDKTRDKIKRSRLSISPFFQNTKLQTNPGINNRYTEPKTILNDCPVGSQKPKIREIRVNMKIPNIEYLSQFLFIDIKYYNNRYLIF